MSIDPDLRVALIRRKQGKKARTLVELVELFDEFVLHVICRGIRLSG